MIAKRVIFLLNLKMAQFWKNFRTYVIFFEKEVFWSGFLYWLFVLWYIEHPIGILELQKEPSNPSNFCIKVRWHFLTHFLNLLHWSISVSFASFSLNLPYLFQYPLKYADEFPRYQNLWRLISNMYGKGKAGSRWCECVFVPRNTEKKDDH